MLPCVTPDITLVVGGMAAPYMHALLSFDEIPWNIASNVHISQLDQEFVVGYAVECFWRN